jgi:hypothetical protein
MRHSRRSLVVFSLAGACLLALASAPAGSLASTTRAIERCPTVSGQAAVLTVALPGRAADLLLTRETLWAAIATRRPGGRGLVVRIDPESGRIQDSFPIPVDPYRLASGFGSLWITGQTRRENRKYQGAVLRVHPRSGRLLSVVRGPRLFGAALATTSAGVWVGGADIYPQGQPHKAGVYWVYKIDPRRNAVVRSVHLRTTSVIDLLGDGPFLWATGWGAVVKLSELGRLLFQQRFDGSGWSLGLTRGTVWVAQPFFGNRRVRGSQRPARRLLRVATSGPRSVTVVEVESPPGGDISAAGGVVWVMQEGELLRIEGAEASPTPTKIAVVPGQLEAFAGGAWVLKRGTHELVKIC